jgi:dihydrofolate synthase/folylpolyglutamate synthase
MLGCYNRRHVLALGRMSRTIQNLSSSHVQRTEFAVLFPGPRTAKTVPTIADMNPQAELFDYSLSVKPRPAVSYEQAMEFWFGCINYEQRAPQPDDLKLDRMRALLERLGNPQQRLRIIHVAGSKGKGSTAAMLAAIVREAGYRAGLFTSPHLCSVVERVQVDGQAITQSELTALLTDVQRASEGSAAGGRSARVCYPPLNLQSPTFFEVATAVGFLHFVRRRVDVAVVEVGLGGRFDSTNVCVPEVALITSISFDHTRQLGNRLASIAMEKAGIVKPGRPTISGATAAEAREVIAAICLQRQAPLLQLGVDFRYRYEPGQISVGEINPRFCRRPRVEVITKRRSWPVMELSLLGEHQAANAAVAVSCVEQLRAAGWQVPDAAVAGGLANVYWPARLEVLSHRPLVVLDCAHNVASAEALVQTLQVSFPPGKRILVFASSNDKDVAGIFRVLGPQFQHVFLTPYGNNPRSIPPGELAGLLQRSADVPSTTCPRAAEAWQAARALAGPSDLICIAGSVFLAGELRPVILGST